MIKPKKIIGVDPGLINTGWAIIESLGSHDKYVSHGVIITKSNESLEKRLNKIFTELLVIFEKYSPEVVAVEKIFSNKNPESSLKLGKARGIVFLTAGRNNLVVNEYSPNTIKKNLVGYGPADKNQIIQMLKRLYPNIHLTSEDAADALAVAICHSMQKHSKISSLI